MGLHPHYSRPKVQFPGVPSYLQKVSHYRVDVYLLLLQQERETKILFLLT